VIRLQVIALFFRRSFLPACLFAFSVGSMAQQAPDLTVGTTRFTVLTDTQCWGFGRLSG
jgi:ABC-type uncharacterized transport system YnjBCD permease subunit